MNVARSLLAASSTAAILLAGGAAGQAETLIGFTDDSPNSATGAFLSEAGVNWAVQWTQTVASSGVSVSAILNRFAGGSANWWITTRLGPATSPTDVLFSGTYVAPRLDTVGYFNFNLAPRTLLATDLSFDPGTYYLVLDGPVGSAANPGEWIGGALTVTTAAGFTLGSYFRATTPPAFGPSGAYAEDRDRLAWFLETSAVPEPNAWIMMIAGFGLVGAVMRHRAAVAYA